MNYINDEFMTYDLSTHRYTLTTEYFNKYFNVNLTDLLINKTDVDPDAVARVFLKRVSNVFYNYILRGAKDYEKSVYMLSLPRFRDGILEGMLELGYSFIVNNTDKSVLMSEIESKPIPQSVEAICTNRGLFNRHFIRLNNGWKDGKGVEY